jgi:hypothetical protein
MVPRLATRGNVWTIEVPQPNHDGSPHHEKRIQSRMCFDVSRVYEARATFSVRSGNFPGTSSVDLPVWRLRYRIWVAKLARECTQFRRVFGDTVTRRGCAIPSAFHRAFHRASFICSDAGNSIACPTPRESVANSPRLGRLPTTETYEMECGHVCCCATSREHALLT